MFNDEVSTALGNYVYRLIDPRNGETFYVGKGVGNRVFHHAAAAAIKSLDEDEDEVSLKIRRIRRIIDSGLSVIHVIHRHGISDAAVFEVEAALIDAFPGLGNVQGGHGSADRGTMHAGEIIKKYGLKVTERDPRHKLLLININRSSDDPESISLYESVRYAWKISVDRARRMNFVLAVRRGVVIEVFSATEWKEALVTNFPGLSVDMPKRWGFEGGLASDETRNQYINTRLPLDAAHSRNPIRYWDRAPAPQRS